MNEKQKLLEQLGRDIKIKELQFALLDLLDSGYESHDIQYNTGFSGERCQELENLYHKTFKEVGKEWKKEKS